MRLGYNTNGFAHHRLDDALAILAAIGYQSVALTLDYHVLDPFADDLPRQRDCIRAALERHRLCCVIETGARFFLDPWHKHQPTLISPKAEQRERRLDFLRRAVDLAADLGADAVSFWSGTPTVDAPFEVHLERLVEGCWKLCDYAAERGVRLAFEPEPGMLVDTMPRYAELARRVDYPNFGLTLDVGHLHCLGETPVEPHVRRWKDRLWNVHLEDMKRGVHEHLMFGEGEIDFASVFRVFAEVGYEGGVHVELSRHSHDAISAARRSFAFLQGIVRQTT
jgi:sugar phosphate isomerase/epimerase